MKIGHIRSFFGPITLCSLNERITHLHFGLSFYQKRPLHRVSYGEERRSDEIIQKNGHATFHAAHYDELTALCGGLQNMVQNDEQALFLFSQFLKGNSTFVKFIQGTPFQQKVWHSLLEIPYGQTKTYQDIARTIGHPKAFQVVGQAISANPIALVVPCHRIILKTGEIGGYRWGIKIKKALLEHEQTKPKTDLFSLFFRPYT